ncbi:MAG: cation transporter [Planctomycetes bacterium]|nr:cation transporter [Planctomycetota bacterium]
MAHESAPVAGGASSLHQPREVRRITLWGLASNIALSGAKFAAGLIGSSQALVADAVHSLSDASTDIAVVVGAGYWSAPADAEHPHGHGRIETLITFFIGLALAGVGVGLGYRAVATLLERHGAPPGWLAFGAACASIVSKEWLYRWTSRVGKRINSSAVIANAWHHRSDALSSIPVAVAVLGTRIEPTWIFLDHIGAVLVSVLIFEAAWRISWPAVRQLVDAGASAHVREEILAIARATPRVRAVHGLRTRQLGPYVHVDLSVLVDPEMPVREGHDIAGAVTDRLIREGPDVVDVLVHIEPYEEAGARPPASPP